MPGLGEIGTLSWARRTNGLLTRSERVRYTLAALAETARTAPWLAAYRAGRGSARRAPIEEADLAVPDSTVAAEAVEACAERLSRSVMEHNLRSYIYARALGRRDRIEHDAELLFVATMFHDYGVVEPDLSDGGRCFTLGGADAASQHLAGAGASAARCDAAAEAITLHVNPAVPLERGPEAHLMHDGVLLDAIAFRAWDLTREGVDLVRSRHPRLGFGREATELLRAQGRAIPRCRAAAALQAGFAIAVQTGPWRD